MAIAIDTTCGFNEKDEHYHARHFFFGHQLVRSSSYAFHATYRNRPLTWRNRISRADLERLLRQQAQVPVGLISAGKRTWWWFQDEFYAITEPFSDPVVIKGLILQWQERRARKAARAQATAAGKSQPRQRSVQNATPSSAAPWQILNVERSASGEDIKKAYLRQVALYHPDKVAHLGPDLQKLAEERTRQINQAYEVLRKKS